MKREQPDAVATHDMELDDSLVALLVDEAGAKFAEGRGPAGLRFGPGAFELLEGVVHLRFVQGADVVLVGPARLELTDPFHARLAYGRIRVIAPPTPNGFTIATPAADYVDLGTEFGLRVDPKDGASDLFVFDGQVNVEASRSGQVLSEVLEGMSARHVAGVAADIPTLRAGDFPTPGEIGFVRWQEHEQRLQDDPGLIAFFPFRPSDDESVLSNAHSDRAVSDGRIVGARWASGRWPGKDALLFDRNDDYVQLDIPGEYRELTIAAWLKVDRLDFEFNAILNSDRSEAGGVHFQLTRQGLPRGGTLGFEIVESFIGDGLAVGRWVHVANCISAQDRTRRIYVNGQIARDGVLVGDETIRPGSCRLGNWLPGGQDAVTVPRRALRARIDELSIWNRALTSQELERLVEIGRPGLLSGEEKLGKTTARAP